MRTLGTLCLNTLSPFVADSPPPAWMPSVLESRRSVPGGSGRRGLAPPSYRADSRLRLGTLLDLETTGDGERLRPSGPVAGAVGLREEDCCSRGGGGSCCSDGAFRWRTGLLPPSSSLLSCRKDFGGDSSPKPAGCRLGVVAAGREPESESTLRMTAFGLGS